jgi:hypothetical protein
MVIGRGNCRHARTTGDDVLIQFWDHNSIRTIRMEFQMQHPHISHNLAAPMVSFILNQLAGMNKN